MLMLTFNFLFQEIISYLCNSLALFPFSILIKDTSRYTLTTDNTTADTPH